MRAPVGGGQDRGARRMAALLVALTLGYGVVVGVLLSTRAGQAPGHTGLALGGPNLLSPGPASVHDDPVPGGPVPLPAEVAPRPVGVSIPAIGVDEHTLVPLGRNPDATMQVPDDFARAGWFTGGPSPGTPGPAVIAGHVDSRSGPAVFFRLRELKAGDTVTVRLSGGGQARFVVDGVSLYSKDDFPTEAVFGSVPGVALRLITCGGSFDRVARSYRSNVVVYASQHVPAG